MSMGAGTVRGHAIEPAHHRADLLLRIAMAVTALGMFSLVVRGNAGSIGAAVFAAGWYDAAPTVERSFLVVLLALALLAAWKPLWPLLALVALGVLADAAAATWVGGEHHGQLAWAAYAPRYLAPLALAVMVAHAWSPSRRRSCANAMLTAALAAAFATHGWAAWHGHPNYVDLIIGSADHLLGVRIPEERALTILLVIGAIDVCLAGVAVLRPGRTVFIWMAGWGAITACSRVTAYGWNGTYEVMLRATHILVPLVVLDLMRRPRGEDAALASATAGTGSGIEPPARP